MPGLLYSTYAIAVLIVAVVGLLAVVFATPNGHADSDSGYKALSVLVALFIVAMIGSYLF